FTGFQAFAEGGGLKAGPYFHVAGLNGPWLIAPVGATARALLSFPAGAARGKDVAPAAALLRYGSALGAGCVCWPWSPTAAMPTVAHTMPTNNSCLMMSSPFDYASDGRVAIILARYR